MSSVAPRGSFAGLPVVASRMVSAELLRLRDSRTVEALLEDTALPCFSFASVAADLGFALIVPPAAFSSRCGGRDFPFVCGGDGFEGVGGALPLVERATDFRVAVDLVEMVDRTDAVETGRLAGSFGSSTALPLTDGVVRDATDAGRDATDGGRFGTRGVLTPVVCVLRVDTLDAADDVRVRATLLAVSSDRAVSNAVDFPLVLVALVESVEARDEPDGVRGEEGPATPFRMVDATERVELIDAATDFGRGGLSLVVVE